MKTFEEFLNESDNLNETYINLIGDKSKSEKEKYKDIVFELLQQSYAKIGGIAGSGFNDPDDMIKNIPFWKLCKKSGKIVAGKMYKDSNGRKSVAAFTDGTPIGKAALADITKNEFDRGMGEVSAAMLGFTIKHNGIDKVKHAAKTVDQAEKILGKKLSREIEPEYSEKYPQLKDYFYSREIGGEMHTKILLGTEGLPIVEY